MFILEYLFWAVFFMLLGVMGILLETSSIVYLLCFVELFYLGINMSIILYSTIWQEGLGIIFSFLILSLTAVETALGLVLIFISSKQSYTTHLGYINFLKN